jgi:hypothetical protein
MASCRACGAARGVAQVVEIGQIVPISRASCPPHPAGGRAGKDRGIIAVNKLLYDHQLARLNAAGAGSAEDRAAHDERARAYAEQIVAWRRDAGLSEAGWPGSEAPANGQAPDRAAECAD